MILETNEERGQKILQLMQEEDHFAYLIDNSDRAMQQIYNEPPDMIILAAENADWKAFLRMLKSDNVFRYLPVLGMFEPDMLGPTTSFENLPIDDLLILPLDVNELRLRVRLAVFKSGRYLDANPLTRLPGNYTIIQTIQELIDSKKAFAMGYIDLDNFKPFNDYYGFSRGDEILRMTARILVNSMLRINDDISFVGHVGGDDFVIVVTPSNIEHVCKQIIANFDMIAATFYDDEDRARGFIESFDRQNNAKQFGFITISIAALLSSNHNFTHYGQISTTANEVKSAVKKIDGSNFLIDRRRTVTPEDEENKSLGDTEGQIIN